MASAVIFSNWETFINKSPVEIPHFHLMEKYSIEEGTHMWKTSIKFLIYALQLKIK